MCLGRASRIGYSDCATDCHAEDCTSAINAGDNSATITQRLLIMDTFFMIDGMWWLVILFVVIAVLWLVAKSRGTKADKTSQNVSEKNTEAPANDSLQKTAALLKQYFPDYRVTRQTNHLLLSQQNKKVAMITIDKKLAIGQRRLGNVPVINYHRAPSRAQLMANLQDAK